MRLTPAFLSTSLLLLFAATVPTTAAAQDGFDEFDDEFAQPAQPTQQPAQQQPQQQQPQQQPAQQQTDEFGDLEQEAQPQQQPQQADGSTTLQQSDLEGAVEETPPSQSTSADDEEEQSDREAQHAYRERRHLLHNTWNGPVGGFHVVDAGSGAAGAFRAQLGTDFFVMNGWLTLPGPTAMGVPPNNSHIGGSLSLSWTPFDTVGGVPFGLEFYGSIHSYANSNPQENPALFQVLGDTLLGVKASYRALPWLFLGGDVGVQLMNTVGDIGLVGKSTSASFRLNATADLRELDNALPIIARFNAQYYLDNSAALVSGVEQARYAALPNPRPCPDVGGSMTNCLEDRHLITRIERYALGINRVDHFTLGFGVELPLQVMEGFHINPIAEWVLNIPVNRQGYNCLFIPAAGSMGSTPAAGQDGCLDKQGFNAFRSVLTVGVRVLPPLRGLNLFAAVDIGTSGMYSFVRELAPTAPYDVMLGVGYAFDTQPVIHEVEREVVREVVREATPPPKGRVLGTVVEQGTDTPVAGAIVAFPTTELTSLSADAQGAFRSYEMDPGEVQMAITHPDYHDGSCTATIPEEGGDVEVRCELEALPRVGSVLGHVVADSGGPVGGATVTLSGPASRTLTTAPDGAFTVQNLPPGTYSARVESENFLIKQDTFDVAAREQATPEIVLIARPRRSLVRVRARQITIRRQVNFATDSAEILPSSTQLLSEVADVILRHPELTKIEIQGHTDNRGGAQHNMELSQRRAEAVRDWLIRAGVSPNQLEARGYGQEQPLVPNITASNRARNRRVQFVIQERSEDQ